jgi:acetyl esterase/lipase
MRALFSCAFVVAVLVAPAAPAGEAEQPAKTFKVKKVKDLLYYDGPGKDDAKHRLDLYLPEGKKDFPVLFFIHGGAWVSGDRNFFGVYGSVASAYAKQGVGVVVISYRLSPGVKHPAHIEDVARAFAWTHKNIGKYGGRNDRLFVSGHSAGGHLAALLAADGRYLKAHGLKAKDVRGVIPISGVYIIPRKLFPKVFPTDEIAREASPITYAKGDLPPFLILYADRDLPGCDKKPAEAFCKALKDKGTRAETVEFKNSNHYNILFDAGKSGSKVSAAVLKFIQTHSAP